MRVRSKVDDPTNFPRKWTALSQSWTNIIFQHHKRHKPEIIVYKSRKYRVGCKGNGPDWKNMVLELKWYGIWTQTIRSAKIYGLIKKIIRSFDENYIMTKANLGESWINGILSIRGWTAINLKYDVTVFRIWLGVEMVQ